VAEYLGNLRRRRDGESREVSSGRGFAPSLAAHTKRSIGQLAMRVINGCAHSMPRAAAVLTFSVHSCSTVFGLVCQHSTSFSRSQLWSRRSREAPIRHEQTRRGVLKSSISRITMRWRENLMFKIPTKKNRAKKRHSFWQAERSC
jgi:hypothetical protein